MAGAPSASVAKATGAHFIPTAPHTKDGNYGTAAQVGQPGYTTEPGDFATYSSALSAATQGSGAQTAPKFQVSHLGSQPSDAFGGLSPSTVHHAVAHYTNGAYSSLNLSAAKMAPGEKASGEVKAIDAAMKAAGPIDKDVVLFRGVKHIQKIFGADFDPENMVGKSWVQKSYSSTSSNQSTAEGFASHMGNNSMVMRILVRAGQAAGVGGTGGHHESESEVILERGVHYRIVADYGVINGSRRFDVEIIGVEK